MKFPPYLFWWSRTLMVYSLSSYTVTLNFLISLHSTPIKHTNQTLKMWRCSTQTAMIRKEHVKANKNLCGLVNVFRLLNLMWLMWLSQQLSEVTYRAAPMFTLHQINAFEDNGFLVMDMCCGDDGQVIGDFTLENLCRNSGEEMDQVYSYSWLLIIALISSNLSRTV